MFPITSEHITMEILMKEPAYTKVKIGDVFEYWEIIGDRFPQTRVIDGATDWFVPCRCKCGFYRAIRIHMLLNNHTKSCGCRPNKHNLIHGEAGRETRTHLYTTWHGMKERCSNPKRPYYERYGGRGISVCKEWEKFEPFRDWAQKNGYSPKLQIDRIDNDGNYSPENCRWVTQSENKRNTSQNLNITAFGETKCLTDWIADPRCKMSWGGLRHRIVDLKWDAEIAIQTPPFNKGNNFHKSKY